MVRRSMLKSSRAVEFPTLPIDKVRFIGDPVVCIVARDRYLAEDAAELVNVEYDALDAVADFNPYGEPDFGRIAETWIPLSNALNCLNRTMGLPDVYPFVLSPPVIEKLRTIHDLVQANARSPSQSAAQERRQVAS